MGEETKWRGEVRIWVKRNEMKRRSKKVGEQERIEQKERRERSKEIMVRIGRRKRWIFPEYKKREKINFVIRVRHIVFHF